MKTKKLRVEPARKKRPKTIPSGPYPKSLQFRKDHWREDPQ